MKATKSIPTAVAIHRSSNGARRAVRWVPYCLILVGLLSVLALTWGCGGSGGSGGTSGPSGVEGYVTIGPIAPAEQPGVTNTRPYSARLTVKTVPGGEIVVVTTSGPDGRFRINLPPGAYRLEPKQGDPLPTAASIDFTVVDGKFTQLTINYDSGIR